MVWTVHAHDYTLNLDVTVSNPYHTKMIATSLKKTDKINTFHLANLLRGGYMQRVMSQISELWITNAL